MVLLLLIGFYDLLAECFSDFGAIVICVLSVASLIRFVAMLSAYPGAYLFWRKKLQLDFNHDYCQRMNQVLEKLVKILQSDFENGRVQGGKYRLSFHQLTGLIDNIYVLKIVLCQHIEVFKRMSECNNLGPSQIKFQRVMEDTKRLMKYKIRIHVEEIAYYQSKKKNDKKILEEKKLISLFEIDNGDFISLVNKIHKC